MYVKCERCGGCREDPEKHHQACDNCNGVGFVKIKSAADVEALASEMSAWVSESREMKAQGEKTMPMVQYFTTKIAAFVDAEAEKREGEKDAECDVYRKYSAAQHETLSNSLATNERLRAALEFYAKRENYNAFDAPMDYVGGQHFPDRGQIAREALKEKP